MRSVIRLVPLLVVGAVLVVGVATADGLLEPGRSERSGVTLAPTVADPTAGALGDWYPINSPDVLHNESDVRVTPVVTGLQLLSRPLPHVPGDCYRVETSLSTPTGSTALEFRNETGSEVLMRTTMQTASGAAHTVTYRAPEPRLSLGLTGVKSRPLTLGTTKVERLPTCPESGVLRESGT